MPIPWEQIQPQPDEGSVRADLALVTPEFVAEKAKAAAERPKRKLNGPLYVVSRTCAHGFDLAFVLGLSFYTAKAIALGFLALYGNELHAFGSGAEDAFVDTFDYATSQLLPGCVAFFSVLYFVALPAVWARTFGLGIFGLKILRIDGEAADVNLLARRFLGCVLVYVSGGSLLISSLRNRPSRLPQDNFSDTCVVKAK